jgi:hypothetical protein
MRTFNNLYIAVYKLELSDAKRTILKSLVVI